MSGNTFQFKKFLVYHDKCAMKVGTDGVLLGAWANATSSSNILDIGCGCGLIALMLAQKSFATIDAIEIDETTSSQAMQNFKISPWEDRLNCINDSFQSYAAQTNLKYDLIISNPPFFENSLKTPLKSRNLARHNDTLSYEDLITHSAQLLKERGSFYIIIPTEAENKVEFIAANNYLFCAEKLYVKGTSAKEPNRILIKFGFEKSANCKTQNLIIYSQKNVHTQEYKTLTKDFYLNF